MNKKHDIFLSYSRDDKERVRPIVEGLEQERLTVWWDENIPPGTTWPIFLKENLDASRMVVVVWSGSSVDKDFVVDEATVGKKSNRLIPVFIEEVDPPLGFGRLQGAKLVSWKGDKNKEWEKFVYAVNNKLGKSKRGEKRKIKKSEKQSEQDWQSALKTNTSEAYIHFVEKHWHSSHAQEALQKFKVLDKKQKASITEKKIKTPPFGQKSGQGNQNTLIFGKSSTQLPFNNSYDYWNKRLKTINQLPAVEKGISFGTKASTTSPINNKEFIFYKHPAFWIVLLLYPLLGLGGAWVADFTLKWTTQQYSFGESYINMPSTWLYVIGVIWGLIYLIYGIIEASDMDDWTELFTPLIAPLMILLDDSILVGFFTILPINLILAWGITFAALNFTVGISNVSAIVIFCVLTIIQVFVYFEFAE